jgi:hypothetical protein
METLEGLRERERMLDEMVSLLKQVAHSKPVLEALNGTGDFAPVLQILRDPIYPEMVRHTKYDSTNEGFRHCVQIAYEEGAHGQYQYWLTSGKPGQERLSGARDTSRGVGNGVFFGRPDTFLTAKHVADGLEKIPYKPGTRDIRLFTMPPGMQADAGQMIPNDISVTDEDVHGSLVTVEGLSDRRKSARSIALRMNPAGAARLFGARAPEMVPTMGNSFLIALEPGEAQKTKNGAVATGMSGSPVFMYKNGRRHFVGILHAVTTAFDKERNVNVDIGIIHGPSQLKALMEAGS